MSPRHNLSFCACKTAWFAPECQVYMCSSLHLCFFFHAKQRLYDQTYKSVGSQTSSVVLSKHNCVISTRLKRLYGFQPSPVVLCKQNSDFWTRITNLYGSQTSAVVLCRQYSVISTRIICLYWTQPLSVVFAFKTAHFGAELHVSMGPRHDLSFCACKTA